MTKHYEKKSPHEKAKESREALAAAVEAMATSDGFQAWLRARSLFHDYSLSNSMLIAAQNPAATQVAGYKTWQKLGRHVRKGERGIRIFAPMIVGAKQAEGEETERRVLFRLVSVFDVAQTEGDDLPELGYRELAGNAPEGMRELLEAVAASRGITIRTESLREGLGGYWSATSREIVLAEGPDGAHSARTLAHELGHASDPWLSEHPEQYAAHRGDCEAVAESVAYVIAAHFGMDAGPAAVGYVAAWTEGDAERVRDVAERIDAAVRSILKPSKSTEENTP